LLVLTTRPWPLLIVLLSFELVFEAKFRLVNSFYPPPPLKNKPSATMTVAMHELSVLVHASLSLRGSLLS
jgi:hypothetical protein